MQYGQTTLLAAAPDGSDALEQNLQTAPTSLFLQATACTHPQQRKEWRTLSSSEKEQWIDAVKCLAATPCRKEELVDEKDSETPKRNQSASWYDDFTYVHMQLNTKIHQTGLFLPWHRYFLWSFEGRLRSVCNYTGSQPYWDWTQDAADFAHATIFNDTDPKRGLGGFGDPSLGGVVTDGAFARMPLTYPWHHHLRREYTPYPYVNVTRPWTRNPNMNAADTFTPQEIEKTINGFVADYKGFQGYLEGLDGPHMSAHVIVGGDLGGDCPQDIEGCSHVKDPQWSPNDPLFWLHHAMVDRVWYLWQRAHQKNFWSFNAGVNRDLDTWPRYINGAPPTMQTDFPLPTKDILFGNFTVADMFNTTANTPLCYEYL
ncbi:hypothetical protein M422DRAFT_250683 [Sphaerobolus stellatus SS14]|uniref:Tyrosinase copper-binding domain-containing protein n=1 Tax=Sphaerobolus stellatus (strain SS14) TaxID=990650 RepID=A0A0C9W3X0_SPHS4|nr:hypothetical protein M422DRAFT_250683 [Sphaerobolus stellatus SS14]